MKEFLIQDNVSLSFEIERVKRSHFERLRQHIENADDAELEAVRDLGSRLYFDCTGPTSTYGTRKWDSKKDRASWQKEAVQPDDPGELVKKLLSSAHGCYWLLEQWDFLKDRLHTGRGHWVPSDKFRAIRLISKQPIDAVDCKTVAQIFTASHALYQAGKPFDNLISDMGEAALDTYVKRVTSLYRDLIGAEDPKKARQFLIELVEENIREIEVVLEEHLEKDREKAQRTIDHHGFNDTREGEAIRRHWLRCRNALVRGAKMNESRRGTPRRDGDGTGLSDLDVPSRDGDGVGLSGRQPAPRDCDSTGVSGLDVPSWDGDGVGLSGRQPAPRDCDSTGVSGLDVPSRDGDGVGLSGRQPAPRDCDSTGVSGLDVPSRDGDGVGLSGRQPAPRDCDSTGVSGLDVPSRDGDGVGLSGRQPAPRDCDSTGVSGPHPPRPPLCKVGRGGAGLRLGRGDTISGDGGADGTRSVPATGNGRVDVGRSGSHVLAGGGRCIRGAKGDGG